MSNQKTKIATWLGFKLKLLEFRQPTQVAEWSDAYEVVRGYVWSYPDDSYHEELPDFYNSVDQCIQWIFPKLKNNGWRIRLGINHTIDSKYAIHLHQFDRKVAKNNQISFSKVHINPATAICEVVDEVINFEEAKKVTSLICIKE